MRRGLDFLPPLLGPSSCSARRSLTFAHLPSTPPRFSFFPLSFLPSVAQFPTSESAFRLGMNDDPMATSKLAEGIRGFSADLVKLETMVRSRLGVAPAPTPAPTAGPAAPADAANGNGTCAEEGKTEYDQLGSMTTIVADSGEIEAIRKFKPTDATTNPSLIYAAAQMPEYQGVVDEAVKHAVGLPGQFLFIRGEWRTRCGRGVGFWVGCWSFGGWKGYMEYHQERGEGGGERGHSFRVVFFFQGKLLARKRK